MIIAEGLKRNSTLQSLGLQNNRINTHGVIALGKALESNSTLKELNIRDNLIGDKAATAIGHALKINTILQKLRLNAEIDISKFRNVSVVKMLSRNVKDNDAIIMACIFDATKTF